MSEDWDLFAVVRSCSSATATATSTTAAAKAESNKGEPLACLASLTVKEEADPFSFPNLAQPSNNGFLQDSYRPFLSNPSPTTTANNPSSANFVGEFGGRHNQPPPPTSTAIRISPPLTPTSDPVFVFGQTRNQQKPQYEQQQKQLIQRQQIVQQPEVQQKQLIRRQQTVQPSEVQTPAAATALPLRPMHSQAPKFRKRKNHQKRTVCHVTVDNLSADPWAWRKYGQKPIKGSSHPRNYYRCSSLKGCLARKQVEQSNSDPNIFIITYTGEHTHPKPTHRNSLAGSTRNKLSTAQKSSSEKTPPSETAVDASCFSPLSAPSVSPTTSLSTPQEGAGAVQDAGVENGTGEGNDMEMVNGESDDDDLLISNIQMDEDLLKGLNEITGGSGEGSSPPFESRFSWASASSGTTAGDGC
ncbi:hypothetical protein SLEP1_g39945 [Rubroshorea leprosula]|uniref:WRKY domain-containing protein n=1 Tax=Rubroshorea leprosula TaxID=152421 RepID=A0AAV5L243_9ROSI|nr:hypothetical protein SLEP1_g39945 [Rubroshorea leprosula]